jgi:hypothetical protein
LQTAVAPAPADVVVVVGGLVVVVAGFAVVVVVGRAVVLVVAGALVVVTGAAVVFVVGSGALGDTTAAAAGFCVPATFLSASFWHAPRNETATRPSAAIRVFTVWNLRVRPASELLSPKHTFAYLSADPIPP